MKALVLTEYNCFEYKDMPQPAIDDDEVLVRVKACGICGSDVHGADGSTGRRQPPVIMGHEAAGVIEQIGDSVTGWKPGDRVTFDSTLSCAKCWYCKSGQINLCDRRRVLGVSCDDYRYQGAFAEFVAVPQHIVYALPEEISFVQGAMVEPLSVAVHATGLIDLKADDKVLVIGTGMIGLLVIQALRAKGCGKIIAVDIDQNKLDTALKLGADFGLKCDDSDIKNDIHGLIGEKGADHCRAEGRAGKLDSITSGE